MPMKKRNPESTSFAPAASSAPRITPEDIQAKEFRIARFRGYRERDVDEFLDQLTLAWGTVLEENRRLRGTTGAPAPAGANAASDVTDRADELVKQAREEADRIVREAQTRAGGIGPSAGVLQGDRQAVSAFLTKEREFLQSLASLVQGHAEGVKGMAREVFTPRTAASAPEAPDDAAVTPAASAPSTPAPGSAERDPAAPAGQPSTGEVSPDAEPIRVQEPEPAAVSGREAETRSESGDRSLRDLFWGEE
jgi:DivIVA domain-containing protein